MISKKDVERARKHYMPERVPGWAPKIKEKEISLGKELEKKYQRYKKKF